MKRNKQVSWFVLAAAIASLAVSHPPQLFGQAGKEKTPSGSNPPVTGQWAVQVNKVEPGDVALEPSFQIAIYENLLDELTKTKRFKQVLRAGDRNAGDVIDLLILKTTVEKYSPGSETKRAVTTVSGATKLTVHSQLTTREGRVILDRTVNGNVRFLGSNLRATHNLAKNVAKAIKQSDLTVTSASAPAKSGQL